jgi:hypothetical protein
VVTSVSRGASNSSADRKEATALVTLGCMATDPAGAPMIRAT